MSDKYNVSRKKYKLSFRFSSQFPDKQRSPVSFVSKTILKYFHKH